MSILKGIIKDLKDDETHIAGCTTPSEIIIALESADSRLDNAIEYNEFTTNGELFEKAHNPFKVIRYEKNSRRARISYRKRFPAGLSPHHLCNRMV